MPGLFERLRDSIAASVSKLREEEEKKRRQQDKNRQVFDFDEFKSNAREKAQGVSERVRSGAKRFVEDRKDTLVARMIAGDPSAYESPTLRKAGQVLQRVPEVKFPEKLRDTLDKAGRRPLIGVGPFGIGPSTTPPAGKTLEFIADLPGETARSFGRTGELLSSKEGVETVARTPGRVRRTLKDKGLALESGLEIIADPGVQAAFDIADFGPGGLVTGLAVGGLKALTKEGGEKLLKELAEKGVKEAPDDLVNVLRKAAKYEKAEDFIKKGITDLNPAERKAIEDAGVKLRDLHDITKKVDLGTAEVEGFEKAGDLVDKSRFSKRFSPDEKLTEDTYKIFNEEYRSMQEALDIDDKLMKDLPKGVTGRQALAQFDVGVGRVGQEGSANIAQKLKELGYSYSPVGSASKELPIVRIAPEAPPGMKERTFIGTVREADTTAPEVADQVEGFYKAITNKKTLKTAQDFIDNQGLDASWRRLKDPTDVSAEKTAIGLDMMRRFQKTGQYEQAVDVAETLAEQATTWGQGVQALSMWARLTPEGALAYASRVIKRANASLPPKKQIEMSAEAAKEIDKLARAASKAPPGSREQVVKAAQLMDKIAERVPPSIGTKISTFQIFAQLLNFKTAIRNVVGNTGFAAIENVKDLVAYPVDFLTGVATGTRTKALPSLRTQASGFKKGFKLGLEDALKGIDTGIGASKFELPKTATFRGEIGKKLQTLLDLELKVPDRAAFQASYEESLRQQMKAAGVKEATEDMVDAAVYDGLYRTFQDDTTLSGLFSSLKKGLNIVGINKKTVTSPGSFGLGDLVLKYPKTPANILQRGIDYSPAGFVSAVFELARPFRTGEAFRQKRFVESVSRALTGTAGLVGTGAALHRLGIITGSAEGEFGGDFDLQQEAREGGFGEYRLNASALLRYLLSGFDNESAKAKNGDMIVSYDWFQPQSIPLAMGADIDANKATNAGIVGAALQGLSTGSQTLVDQPLLSGVQELTGFNDIPQVVLSVLANAPSSMTPTILNQLRQLLNNETRDTTDPSLIKQSVNRTKLRVPLLANTLPQKMTTRGVPMEMYQNGTNHLFNVMFNPAFVSRLQQDPIGKEVFEIFRESGEKQQAPRVVSRSIQISKDGKAQTVKLNGKQKAEMQAYVGYATNYYFSKLVEREEFQKLAPDEKAKKMSNIMSDIFQAAKIDLLGHAPSRVSNDTTTVRKLLRAAKKAGALDNTPLISR